jgi:hypothetical protein
MVVGRRDLGPDRFSQHPSESPFVQRDLLNPQEARKTGVLEGSVETRSGFWKRNIAKVNGHSSGSIVTGDCHVVRGYEVGNSERGK